jgi:CRP-like cAMP-binding protein
MDNQMIQNITQSPDFQNLWGQYEFLDMSDLTQLLSIGKIVQIDKNEHFLRTGDYSKKVGMIMNGLIRFYHLKDGEEYNLIFKKEQQMVSSFECIILNQPSSYSFEALEDTLMVVYDYDKMEVLFSQNPRLERFGRYFIQNELAQAIKVFEKHLFYSPEERYLKFIEEYPNLMNRVPLKHLASFMGVTPVSLSRIRKRVTENKH